MLKEEIEELRDEYKAECKKKKFNNIAIVIFNTPRSNYTHTQIFIQIILIFIFIFIFILILICIFFFFFLPIFGH
jgi:hypothetical protein